jgi:hypothetical protein
MRARRMHGEEGAALVLVLAFLMLTSLFVPALLNLGTTNLLATSRLVDQRGAVYAVDGATDGAIQFLRLAPDCGRPNQVQGTAPLGCPTWTSATTSMFQAIVGGKAASVVMTATGSSGTLDRTVAQATTIAGVTTAVHATVVLHDPGSGDPATAPVDVQTWTLTR